MKPLRVVCKAIEQKDQRYATVGDYWTEPDGTEQIRSSRFPDWRMEVLVMLHEFVETMLCRQRGIPEATIKAFDEAFEATGEDGEPGDQPDAPYWREHQFATYVERSMCHELRVDWEEYGRECDRVYYSVYDQKGRPR